VRRGPAELFGAGFVQGPGAPAAPAAPDPYLFPDHGAHGSGRHDAGAAHACSGGALPIALSSSEGEDGVGEHGRGGGSAWMAGGVRWSAPSLPAHLERILGLASPTHGWLNDCMRTCRPAAPWPGSSGKPWNSSSCVWSGSVP